MSERKAQLLFVSLIARVRVGHGVLALLLIAGGVAVFLFSRWHAFALQPLSRDEEIITHFREHRADIEALVASYRKFRPLRGRPPWQERPEVQALMRRAGMGGVRGELPAWFPQPYTVRGAKRFERAVMRDEGRRGTYLLRPYETVALWRQEPGAARTVIFPTGPRLVVKRLVYTPEVPRIENGILLPPASSTSASPVPWPAPARVFASLDAFPAGFSRRGECIYRRLEAQWFIRMCIAP